jgi:hypothetical protein
MSRKVAGAALDDGASLMREPPTHLSILEENGGSIVGFTFRSDFLAPAGARLGKTETRSSGPLCGAREDARIFGKPENVG